MNNWFNSFIWPPVIYEISERETIEVQIVATWFRMGYAITCSHKWASSKRRRHILPQTNQYTDTIVSGVTDHMVNKHSCLIRACCKEEHYNTESELGHWNVRAISQSSLVYTITLSIRSYTFVDDRSMPQSQASESVFIELPAKCSMIVFRLAKITFVCIVRMTCKIYP